MTEQHQRSIVQFDPGKVKVDDGEPYTPALGATILEATGHMRLVRIGAGPIVLQVEHQEPRPSPAATEPPESLIQSHTIRFGPSDDRPGSGDASGTGGGVTFQNNFHGDASVGNWVTGETITIERLD